MLYPTTLTTGATVDGDPVSDGLSQPGASDAPTTQDEAPKLVPLTALEAERRKRQEVEARLAERERADAEAEQQRLAKQGEWQRIAEEATAKLAALEPEVATFRERETQRLAARVEKVPEAYRRLIPEGLTGAALEAHLDALADTLAAVEQAAKPPSAARASGGGVDPDALSADVQRWWDTFPGRSASAKPATIVKLYNSIGPGKRG